MLGNRFYTRASMAIGAPGLRLAGKLNVPLYRASGGRLFGKIGTAPVLLLTATGRKSGKERTVPVVYMPDRAPDGSERYIVIGSNAGHARTPAWSHNLAANPSARVQVGRRRMDVNARIAEGAEREELWRRMNSEWYEGFDTYAGRTDRDIRLFVLEPR